MTSHHAHHHDHHQAGAGADEAALVELLDLDAEVLHAYLSDVIDWIGGLAAGQRRRRILDRLRSKAHELGVAGRVHAIQADLDEGWPDTGPVDLVWASNSMHHMAD